MHNCFRVFRFLIISTAILLSKNNYAEYPELNRSSMCSDKNIPLGANSIAGINKILCLEPTNNDVHDGHDGISFFYPGTWYRPIGSSKSVIKGGVAPLILKPGGEISTVNMNLNVGKFPLVPGNKSFYIEVCARTSNNNSTNWPAIWMLPIEHNRNQPRSKFGDPDKFERWMELDIDEGGFSPGVANTVHSWRGIWPSIKSTHNSNNYSYDYIDRTKPNCFGVSYYPDVPKIVWWLNDYITNTASASDIPDIAVSHNYFLILTNQVHGNGLDFDFEILSIRLFSK